MAKRNGKNGRQTDTTLTPDKKSGVTFDKNGPVVTEPIDASEVNRLAHEQANAQHELDLMEATWKDKAAGHRADKKELKDRITELAEQVRSGVRRIPAQKTLPGTNGAPDIEAGGGASA